MRTTTWRKTGGDQPEPGGMWRPAILQRLGLSMAPLDKETTNDCAEEVREDSTQRAHPTSTGGSHLHHDSTTPLHPCFSPSSSTSSTSSPIYSSVSRLHCSSLDPNQTTSLRQCQNAEAIACTSSSSPHHLSDFRSANAALQRLAHRLQRGDRAGKGAASSLNFLVGLVR